MSESPARPRLCHISPLFIPCQPFSVGWRFPPFVTLGSVLMMPSPFLLSVPRSCHDPARVLDSSPRRAHGACNRGGVCGSWASTHDRHHDLVGDRCFKRWLCHANSCLPFDKGMFSSQ